MGRHQRTLAGVPLQRPLDTVIVPFHSLRLLMPCRTDMSPAFCGSLKWFNSANSDTWPSCGGPRGLSICFSLPGLTERCVICHTQFPHRVWQHFANLIQRYPFEPCFQSSGSFLNLKARSLDSFSIGNWFLTALTFYQPSHISWSFDSVFRHG